MARIRFEYSDRELRARISGMTPRLNGAIAAVVDYNAMRAEAAMKANAPWHDNTGAARVGLHTMRNHQGNRHEIILAHSVYYGIWLELAHSGRYQIIMPTTRMTGDALMNDLRGLLGRM